MSDPAPSTPGPEPVPEEEGRGLLVVDLLSLAGRFSFRRYREDIVGFLVAWAIVGALIGVALGCAALGSP